MAHEAVHENLILRRLQRFLFPRFFLLFLAEVVSASASGKSPKSAASAERREPMTCVMPVKRSPSMAEVSIVLDTIYLRHRKKLTPP